MTECGRWVTDKHILSITYYKNSKPITINNVGKVEECLKNNKLTPCIVHQLNHDGEEMLNYVVKDVFHLSDLKPGDKFRFHTDTRLSTEHIFTMCKHIMFADKTYVYVREDFLICHADKNERIVMVIQELN
jgi:hypothetical protein